MATAYGAAISVFVRKSERGSVIVFVPLQGNSLEVHIGSTMSLTKEVQRFRHNLEEFKATIRRIPQLHGSQESKAVGTALLELYGQGQAMAGRLFGGQSYAVQQFFARAWWTARMAGVSLPLLEVHALLEDMIAFEFMPLFDFDSHRHGLDDRPRYETPQDIEKLASYFVGFTMIVKRRILRVRNPGKNSNSSTLWNPDTLPIKFFQHAALHGAKHEETFFKLNAHSIDLEGPWPDKNFTSEVFENRFAEHIWSPTNRFDGTMRPFPDQIQHFACHCETESSHDGMHALHFSHNGHNDYKITIDNLDTKLYTLKHVAPRNGKERLPVVFLNACEATAFDPGSLISFPRFFLENQNRGVIGAEAHIPDIFAANFTIEFYSHLLAGYGLGEALHAARWCLLKEHLNPLGLLYTLYADPDMFVLKPAKVNRYIFPVYHPGFTKRISELFMNSLSRIFRFFYPP